MATDETRFELKVSDSSKNFLEKKKEEHRRERSDSRQQEDGERRSSFVLLGDTSTAKKRTENKFNSMYVNDEHLIHDGVHIRRDSKCCGKSDAEVRTHLFHKLESTFVRWLVVMLLAIDVLCVIMEILFADRIIEPSFNYKTQPGTLYVPSNYVCADSHTVTNAEKLTECCTQYGLIAKGFSPFKSNQACFDAHYNHTVLTGDSHTSSSSGSSYRRRFLLSSTTGSGGHGPTLPNCYRPPPSFRPHLTHELVEQFVHWLSLSILILFAIELLFSIYVFGPKQFFCSCYRKIKEGEAVEVIAYADDSESATTIHKGIVHHINVATGDIDVTFDKGGKTMHDVPRIVISKPKGAKQGILDIEWHHKPHILDFIVVYVSLIFELVVIFHKFEDYSINNAIQFLILFRVLRYIRVIHGIYESKHKLSHEIESTKEFKSDVKWFFDKFEEQISQVKIQKVSGEKKDSDVYKLRQVLRHIKVLVEEFNEDNAVPLNHGEHGKHHH